MGICAAIMIFILGLCCGSFVNMLVYRTAVEYELIKSKGIKKNRNVSFLKMLGGRSFCDDCGKQLHWYENIPVISWMIQRGRTKCCDQKLSILYPIVEITTGVLFLVYNLMFLGQDSNLMIRILGVIIIVFLIFSTVFDLKYMILPDFSMVILICCGLLMMFDSNTKLVLDYIFSAAVSFGFLGLLYLITKGKGMGLGDVKLAVFMGLFLGGQKVILAFYIAFVIGALVSLILMFFKKAGRKTLIPFGPFLILGVLVSWFWGDKILYLVSSIWY
jgi:prepilin signal peptidase PulO-like enzyme (type II secretory pathway)